MALIVNIYKEVGCVNAYSKDGAMTDPVFEYPTIDFDGDSGQSRDVQLFLRNDGDLIIRDLVITPADASAPDETSWMKLATSQGGLAAATPGAALSYGSDLNPAAIYTFWERMTVPASTSPADKSDLSLQITCKGYES